MCANFYVESEHPDATPFQAGQGEAFLNYNMQNFYIRKKRPDEDISIRKLSAAAQRLFLGKGGSRDKEWKAVQSA